MEGKGSWEVWERRAEDLEGVRAPALLERGGEILWREVAWERQEACILFWAILLHHKMICADLDLRVYYKLSLLEPALGARAHGTVLV